MIMKIYQFITILMLTLPMVANANCIEGNCVNGEGVRITRTGDRWEGRFVNSELSGKGVWKSKQGDYYHGEFLNGKMNGKGKLKLTSGDVYIGEFSKGLFHGTGRYKYINGDEYFGGWIRGTMNGTGTYRFSSGKMIKGQFENGAPITSNVVQTARSETPSSQPVANESTLSPDTDTDNYRDCTTKYCDQEKGILKYRDGSKYIGEFKKGSPHGMGRCEYINGDIYEGEWKYNSPHGKGIMHFASGKKYAAMWSHGKPSEQLLDDLDFVTAPKKKNNVLDERVDIYALVVGVATYEHMPSLKYTDDDAYQVFAFLKSPEGGAIPEDKIKVLIDAAATKNNILIAMEQLFSRADANDMVLLYISGHGLDGSFIPSDFDGYSNNIPYKEITKIIDRSEAKSKICIADACHSGSLVSSKSAYQASLDDYYTVLKESRGGTALMMSSAAEEVSLEYSGLRQGIFSHFLLRGMKGEADADNNKIVSIAELFRFISAGVGTYTASMQTPILTGMYDPSMPVAMIR